MHPYLDTLSGLKQHRTVMYRADEGSTEQRQLSTVNDTKASVPVETVISASGEPWTMETALLAALDPAVVDIDTC